MSFSTRSFHNFSNYFDFSSFRSYNGYYGLDLLFRNRYKSNLRSIALLVRISTMNLLVVDSWFFSFFLHKMNKMPYYCSNWNFLKKKLNFFLEYRITHDLCCLSNFEVDKYGTYFPRRIFKESVFNLILFDWQQKYQLIRYGTLLVFLLWSLINIPVIFIHCDV